MTSWVKIFTELLFYAYVDTPSENSGLLNNYQRCPMSLSRTFCKSQYHGFCTFSFPTEIPFPQTLVIPQHQQAMIECQDERFINILDAHFGNPKQAEICLEVSGDQSCNAESSISRMKALCQNKHSCIPQALIKQFGDPCFEDFKYLHVEFSCVYEIVEEPSIVTSIRACLGQSVSLLCDAGQEIFIEEFFFGRLANDGYCLKDGEALPAEDQISATALELVRDLCHTKQSCLVQADTGTFGNPWAEGDEYMEITYKCSPQKQ